MNTAISPKVIRQRLFWRVLVILQSREFDLGVFGIGAIPRLAVMPQRLLRKPFWIARHFRPFRPSVAVAVQRNACNAQTLTTLLELRRTAPLVAAAIAGNPPASASAALPSQFAADGSWQATGSYNAPTSADDRR